MKLEKTKQTLNTSSIGKNSIEGSLDVDSDIRGSPSYAKSNSSSKGTGVDGN